MKEQRNTRNWMKNSTFESHSSHNAAVVLSIESVVFDLLDPYLKQLARLSTMKAIVPNLTKIDIKIDSYSGRTEYCYVNRQPRPDGAAERQ